MALMWPLQHTSRTDEFEPPMGTAQEERVVGGEGIWLGVEQDIVLDMEDCGSVVFE
jgi:hypothetical protein